MRQAAPGDEVVMTIDDPKAESEIAILSREHGWTLVRAERSDACVLTIAR